MQVRGLCKNHYNQARAAGDIPIRPKQPEICTVDNCGKPTQAKGLCDMHYRRLRNRGVTTARTIEERFLRSVPERPTDGYCWQWRGRTNPQGYGQFKIGDVYHRAHRVSYELFVAPIPEGLHLDHLCSNKTCVNPEHLEPVTQRENNLRSLNMAGRYIRRTECHICGGELVFRPNLGPHGCRVCTTCEKRRQAKSKANAKARKLSAGSSSAPRPA